MGLSSALFSSVSGLDASGTAISVIGDNIANVNTPGFKARRADFGDVLGQSIAGVGSFSQLGAGVTLQRITPIFSQGSIETSSRTTDLAIEGAGFFVVDGPRGTSYSRAGLFSFDSTGLMVNPQGLRVQGFSIDPITGLSTGQLGDIQLSTATSPPRATSTASLSVNLDANAPVTAPFSAADPNGTSSFSTTMTVHDSLGNARTALFYFGKTAANSWEWNVALDPADTTLPAGGNSVVVQGSGTLSFDSSGLLTGLTGSPVTFEFSGGAAGGQAVDLSFGPIAGAGSGDPTTQFGVESATNSFNQDGFGAGTLQSIVIDLNGVLTGQFSSGSTIPLAQVALANFPNVEGLVAVGNNNLLESRASGQPLVGQPRTGSLGAVRSSNLEGSNVDLANEFVRLIINQRAFQANTRTVSTTNELLANLVTLGQ